MKSRTIIVGGLLAILLVGSIGAVFTTAQNTTTNTTQNQDPWQPPQRGSRPENHSNDTMMFRHNGSPGGFHGCIPPGINLTADQRQQLNETITALQQENATEQEIRTAIQVKLDEFGVFDQALNNTITQTERRLTILKRQQELREQGYNWTQIETMITEEYGQNTAAPMDHGMMMNPGPGCGRPRGTNKPDW